MKWLAYLLCLVLLLLFAADALAVTIPTVPVGNAGNAADTEVMLDGTTGYGSVAYDYRVGRYEVTNAQYAEFLNAKAASDPLSLYSGFMGSLGGITRSGISGSYTYATITGWGDKPVNFVNWYDSIRFANWLNNGQGTGDTETGAYTLLGGTPFPSNGLSITRNAAATWFLPSENEWYKAAYYDPTSSSYFDFPTASNAVPIAEPPPGGGNSANYDVNGAFLTDVGAYSGSESPYGTSDQGGNVSEWNDALIRGSSRGWRGGYYSNNSFLLRSKARIDADPTDEYFYNGFRVATIPEPSTFALAALGMLGIVLRRWSRPMPMHRTMCHLCIWSALACYAGSANLATAGPLVYVGNPGNPPDQNYGGNGQFGAVPDGYRISIHEVTNAEYAVFLNANVSIRQGSLFLPPIFGDPASLLNSSMLDDPRGGMEIYSPACVGFLCGGGLGHSPPPPPPRFRGTASMYNKPVNFVSWYDAARYVNWLHNGQGSGSTETGAYALGPLGNGGVPLDPAAITRNPGATWFLPNENEWYKAAYYQPAAAGGDSDGYWLSPTRSNATTAIFATSDSAGNISNPGADVMNESGATWNGQTGNVTTVGSAGPLSASFYGTFDQGGNVAEWTETWAASGFVTRGGSWNAGLDIGFRADQRTILPPTYEAADLGFRIAQVVWIVPEPSTFALVAVGILGLIVSRKCRRSIGSTVVLLALAVCAADARAVTIPTVPVGNPGNANGTIGFGAVSYDYRIGTTEVTNDQYAEFLNAKAASDPLALYNGNMGSDPRGGIAQSGVDVIVDFVQGEPGRRARPLLAVEGRHLLCGHAGGLLPIHPNEFYLQNWTLVGVCMGSGYGPELMRIEQETHDAVMQLVRSGRYRATTTRVICFAEIPAALRDLAQRRSLGRIVALP